MKKKTLLGYAVAVFSLSVIMGVARCLNVNRLLNENLAYPSSAVTPLIYRIVMYALVAFFFIIPFVLHKQDKSFAEYNYNKLGAFDYIADIFCAVLLVMSSIPSFKIIMNTNEKRDVFAILTAILSVLSAVYFIMLAINGNKPKIYMAVFSFFPIVRCVISAIKLYFDQTVAIGNPNKILTEIAFLGATLFLLGESRFHLKISKGYYILASAGISLLLLVSAILPNLFLKDVLATNTEMMYEYYIAQSAIMLFIVVRLINYVTGTPKINNQITDNKTE